MSQANDSAAAAAAAVTAADANEKKSDATPKRRSRASPKPRKLPPYNVVLMNDDDHTYEYVVEMLKALFGFPDNKGFKLAEQVDTAGRVIVLTTTKEHAELKRDQIHAYGKDWRISRCAGSMSARIEPAE
jgi:ATP-dependent Clp protease adaptor protein ClpS